MIACGEATREIRGHLQAIAKEEVSPSLISAVMDALLENLKAWQARRLHAVHLIVYLDAVHVEAPTGGHIQTQAAYPVMPSPCLAKLLLGLRADDTEPAQSRSAYSRGSRTTGSRPC